jgi:hypothetical protein
VRDFTAKHFLLDLVVREYLLWKSYARQVFFRSKVELKVFERLDSAKHSHVSLERDNLLLLYFPDLFVRDDVGFHFNK